MLWKGAQVVWSTYYALLRTSGSETRLTFFMETRLQHCHLLTVVCVLGGGGWGGGEGFLGCSCTAAEFLSR